MRGIAEAQTISECGDRFLIVRIGQRAPHRLQPPSANIGADPAILLEQALQAGARDAERAAEMIDVQSGRFEPPFDLVARADRRDRSARAGSR